MLENFVQDAEVSVNSTALPVLWSAPEVISIKQILNDVISIKLTEIIYLLIIPFLTKVILKNQSTD